jgi:hypothetical protein
LVGKSRPPRPQAARPGGPGAAPPALRSASRAPLLTRPRKRMIFFIFRMRRSPVLQHAACGSRVPFGGVGCPGPQAGCNHARAAAWCTPAGSSITQPYNSHCSSICCVVESPCWARVWVRMRVQQRVHLVPAAGGYLPRSLLRFRSPCSIPRQSLA